MGGWRGWEGEQGLGSRRWEPPGLRAPDLASSAPGSPPQPLTTHLYLPCPQLSSDTTSTFLCFPQPPSTLLPSPETGIPPFSKFPHCHHHQAHSSTIFLLKLSYHPFSAPSSSLRDHSDWRRGASPLLWSNILLEPARFSC